jgi:hypothetical protein
LRSIFDLRRVFVVVLFGGIVVLAARNITDPDFWWHLRTGQYIVQTRSVPHVDPFSFTRLGHLWVAHEWLSELIIYGVYRVSGWGGLIVGFALLTAATFFFLYLRCSGEPYVAGALALLAAFACIPAWGVRPQTFSFLLASVLLWLLERSARSPGLLWWIVPMTLLWANLHAGYSLEIALVLLWLIGLWLDRRFGFEQSDQTRSSLRQLPLVLLFSALVVVLNPNGMRLYSYPLDTLRSGSMQKHIAEWSSPDFHRGMFVPFLALLLGLVAAPAVTGLRLSPRKLLFLCLSAYAALHSSRFIPIFVLVATPLLAEHVKAWFELRRWDSRFRSRSATTTTGKASLNATMLLVLGIVACVHIQRIVRFQPLAEAAAFPAAAVAFLGQQRSASPVFNSYDWGGYLIWRLPGERVFIDGRADLYGDEFFEQHINTYNLTGNWKQDLERWKIATVIVPVDSPLATALATSKAWQVVFHDSQAAIWQARGASQRAGTCLDPAP